MDKPTKDMDTYLKELDNIYQLLRGYLDTLYKTERAGISSKIKYMRAIMYNDIDLIYEGFKVQYGKALYKAATDCDNDEQHENDFLRILNSEENKL